MEQHAQSLRASLAAANLSPGSASSLIPEGFKPTVQVDVAFNGRKLELGNLFRASECKTAPTVSFTAEV